MLIRPNHKGDRIVIVHLPHPSSSIVVGVVRHYGGDLSCVFRRAWKIFPTLILVPGVIIQRKRWKQKGRLYELKS
jgi:hypothetical protein